MSGKFADSNALLYLASDDERKARIAETILGESLTISVQVLNELANVFHRKWRRDWDTTSYFLEIVRDRVVVVPLTLDVHELGLVVARLHRLAVYDAMIVAAALLADCDTLYSEDMHDGLVVDGRLRIVNPFRAD